MNSTDDGSIDRRIAERFHAEHPEYRQLPVEQQHKAAARAMRLAGEQRDSSAAATALYYLMLANVLDDMQAAS